MNIYFFHFTGDLMSADGTDQIARWIVPVRANSADEAADTVSAFLSERRQQDEALEDITECFIEDIVEINPEQFTAPTVLLYSYRDRMPIEADISRSLPTDAPAGLATYQYKEYEEQEEVTPFLSWKQ